MTARVVAAAVALCVALSGSLAPHAAGQQPSQPAAPTQPELFREQLKVQPEGEENAGAYAAGAVAVNIFLVPGRAITCGLGGLAAGGLLLLTFGTAYRAASAVVHEGCGGKWIVTGDDLRPGSDVPLTDWGRP
jgi:hypothetical protein